jgi:protein PhnA
MSLPADARTAIETRAGGACELCGADSGLAVEVVAGAPTDDANGGALLCRTCAGQVDPASTLDEAHLRCLQTAAWSPDAPIQVLCLRLLGRLGADWSGDLLGQIWVEDEVRAWADAGAGPAEAAPVVVDSNGTPLADGDAVTLIKDLVVKGGGFTAKRGTMVKNIRLGDDPTHIEGRVNKQAIMLKTAFLKKAN